MTDSRYKRLFRFQWDCWNQFTEKQIITNQMKINRHHQQDRLSPFMGKFRFCHHFNTSLFFFTYPLYLLNISTRNPSETASDGSNATLNKNKLFMEAETVFYKLDSFILFLWFLRILGRCHDWLYFDYILYAIKRKFSPILAEHLSQMTSDKRFFNGTYYRTWLMIN